MSYGGDDYGGGGGGGGNNGYGTGDPARDAQRQSRGPLQIEKLRATKARLPPLPPGPFPHRHIRLISSSFVAKICAEGYGGGGGGGGGGRT